VQKTPREKLPGLAAREKAREVNRPGAADPAAWAGGRVAAPPGGLGGLRRGKLRRKKIGQKIRAEEKRENGRNAKKDI
jgi:hypothetical protein